MVRSTLYTACALSWSFTHKVTVSHTRGRRFISAAMWRMAASAAMTSSSRVGALEDPPKPDQGLAWVVAAKVASADQGGDHGEVL